MHGITYLDLKKQIAYNVATSDRHREKLDSLKSFFREDINSPRQYEKIETISELLRVLETRDVLSENDIQPLKEIATKMPNSDELLGTIGRYEWTQKQKELPIYQVPETILGKVRISPNEKFSTENFNNGISLLKKQRIYEAVIENIGTFWCALGRNLKIRECVIDEINQNYGDRYAKATRLMEFYEQRADPESWFFDLCHALDETKMVLLRKKIQQIMMMNF
ncbi:uncharacterized protein LOC128671020 [Plodia interpunctella]|uniref:uncharacterized protein LOC128671020 n=1 Tax=Plodia interpunctella TaxID=58824 RepID=UPI0023688808|nr:uncharacterized protein LOC128671020 [Plodia interpunctella]